MNKLIITAVAFLLFIASCRKAAQLDYHSQDNIYFDLSSADRDSIVYTFAYHPGKLKDTILLPVRISGIRLTEERSFGIQVVDTATTAIGNTHYEPFTSAYTMPADSGICHLPVIIYNKDESLVLRPVAMTLQLVATDKLGVALPTLIRARIVISNKLEKPKWWDMWLGGYSQVKHQLFRLVATTEDLTTEGIDAPKNLYYTGKLTSFLNDPFNWVKANPGKGYVLTQRPDGHYDFYHTGTPDKKILLKKNDATGKFYFIDENGKEVV
jgi:hypothetical protein